jgi:tetratricopeptide (TPR) repeat protein
VSEVAAIDHGSSPAPSCVKVRRSLTRAIGFRLAAVFLGLLPFLAFEGLCRLTGWGLPATADDPFVGFSAARPLFALSGDGSRYEIAQGKLTHFQPDSFAARKPPGEFRIFCLGGSTVQGRPYSIETSFTTWLQLSLQAADSSRSWRVVNCGGVSYASYRLVPLLEEVLSYEPDLIIFYEGHNEFLEDRTYAEIKHAPRWFTWLHEQAAGWHTYNLMRATIYGRDERSLTNPPPTTLPPEVDARLDWSGGMDSYHRDAAWQHDCIQHFAFNLRRAVAIAKAGRVPLLFVNPASNLDWPPIKAECRDDLSEEENLEVERLWTQARESYRTNQAEALPLLRQAAAIDDQHAGLQFDLGKCLQNLGQIEQAREALVRAKDLDVCPLRILEPMNRLVLQVARDTGTMLVDADELFSSRSPGGINGPEWFVDHVHPTIEGHQLLADALADELVRKGFVSPSDQWAADRTQRYEQHMQSLLPKYFRDGVLRLKGEQRWAHGQTKRDRKPRTDK